MSSGFVSGGTNEKPIERDDAWLKAEAELEAERKAKAELSKHQDGKSLYQVLEENKAAKQDAFEESIKLRNQFRALNDDEIDFLDEVLESTRAKEKAIKEETAAQLEVFRKLQQEEEASQQAALDTLEDESGKVGEDGATAALTENAGNAGGEESSWSTGRKRKIARERELLKGVKVRKTSEVGDVSSGRKTDGGKEEKGSGLIKKKEGATLPKSEHEAKIDPDPDEIQNAGQQPKTAGGGLGLAGYDSSDSDD